MSVYRPKNSPYYQFDFQWQGERFHGSTKRTKQRDAEKVEAAQRQKVKRTSADAKASPPQDAAARRSEKAGAGRHDSLLMCPGQVLRTPKYAAARLACSLQTLLAYVRAGTIKYVQVGVGAKRPRRMFTDADLDDFVVARTRREYPCQSASSRGPKSFGKHLDLKEIVSKALRDKARNARLKQSSALSGKP